MTEYTLVLDPASYAFTGSNASPLHAWIVTAGTTSYSFTATAASPLRQRKVVAAAASYAFTASTVAFVPGKQVITEAASYAFTPSRAYPTIGEHRAAGTSEGSSLPGYGRAQPLRLRVR